MTATAGPSDARGQTKSAPTVNPRVPDHLVVWPGGEVDSAEWQITDEALREPHFRLAPWVAAFRADHPDSLVAATFPAHFSGRSERDERRSRVEWLELTTAAAGIDHEQGERSFTGDTTPTSLSALRHWALGRLDGRPVALDDIVLALSELSTNVERHGGDWLTVDLVDRDRDVLLAVTDPACDRLPVPRDAGPDEATGRGLLVVAALALRWGLVVHPTYKTVWAAFPHLT